MAGLATQADSGSEKRERNRRNTGRAYDSVQRFRRKVVTSAEETKELNRKLGQLQIALLNLGERF
jgi:hypothetical protein